MLSPLKSIISKILSPLTELIVRTGIKPNHLTILGLVIGLFSAYFIATGYVMIGGFFILVSGFFDILDGALARNQMMVTEFGGFLDSVLDRYVDVAIFIALGVYGINWLYVAIAMSGALLVSYTRARAEKVIEKCDVGIAERGERLVILFIGIAINQIEIAVLIVAVLSHLTALHRVLYTYGKLR